MLYMIQIATESISNIRTVASFSLEKNFDEQYTINIEKPYKLAKDVHVYVIELHFLMIMLITGKL